MSKSQISINNIDFTEAESRVLTCLACHVTHSKIIGSILGSSPRTINTHIDNIKRKIKVNNKYEIIEFIEKSKQINQLKEMFNVKHIEYQYGKAAKAIAHSLSILNLKCTCSLSPNLDNDQSVTEIFKAIELLNIKLAKVDDLQSLLDGSSGSNANKFGLLIAKSLDEIESFLTHTTNVNSNIIYICLDHKAKKSHPQDILFYDSNNKKEFYHFLIKYLIKQYPQVDKLNAELDFLSSIDNIGKSDKSKEEIDQTVNENLRNSILNSRNIMVFISIIICLTTFYVIWKHKQEGEHSDHGHSHKSSKRKKTNILTFNLPLRNNNFTGRHQVFDQIDDNLNKRRIGSSIQVMVGSGGIGKTQLLTEYAYRAIEEGKYDVVFWLDASTNENINNKYIAFAKYLEIELKNTNPKVIKKLVHNKLINEYKAKDLLIILDDVSNKEDISNYLETIRKQLPVNARTHILISSRNQYWTNTSMILDIFTEEEAKEFIKSYLPNETKENIARLSSLLNYYPLALGQAVGYIKQHTNIDDYIELYSDQKAKYLNKTLQSNSVYKDSLWHILTISLSQLSIPAKEILYTSSYLDPSSISLSIFNKIAVEERVEAIKELKEHSLITMTDHRSAFKIHALLQEIVRLKISDQYQWLDEVFAMARDSLEKFDKKKKDTWDDVKKWMFHIKYLSLYLQVTPNTIDTLKEYAKVAEFFGFYKLEYSILNNILLIQQKHYDTPNHLELVDTILMLGSLELKLGNYRDAKQYYQQVLAIQETHYKNPKHIDFAKTLNGLGKAELKLGNYEKAKSTYNRALQIQKLYYNDSNHIDITDTLFGLGVTEFRYGYYNESKSILNNVLNITNAFYKDKHNKKIINILTYLGILEMSLENYQKAKEIVQKVIDINQEIYKDDNIAIAYPLQVMAVLEWKYGDFQKAKEIYSRVLNINKMHYEKEHISSAITYQGLGLVEFGMGNYENAKNLLEKDLSIRKNYYDSSNHISLTSTMHTLAMTYEMLYDYDLALNYMNQVYGILNEYYQDRLVEVMYTDYSKSMSFPEISPPNVQQALNYYLNSIKLIKNTYGNEHILSVRYHFLLGQVYQLDKQKDKAKEQYQQALEIARLVANRIKQKDILIKFQNNIQVIENKLNSLTN